MVGVSLVFVAMDGLLSVLLLIGLTAVNFYGARAMQLARPGRQALWLWALIGVNVFALGSFKYYNAFNRFGALFTEYTGFEWPLPHVEWALPLGLSYYVFQAIGFLVDQYLRPEPNKLKLSHFVLFMAWFPKITAGPIERFAKFSDQLYQPIALRYANIRDGGRLLLWGFFKKFFISSHLSQVIAPAFETTDLHGVPLIGVFFFYTVLVYLDVSAYTDIAIGGSRLFGIQLSDNFNRPYRATSISDFWRRWHMSLSGWVNDYIFRPLSLWLTLRWRMGQGGLVAALFLSFLVIGIWHGSDWNFAVFGGIHGAILSLELVFRKWGNGGWKLPVWGKRIAQVLYVQFIFAYSCLLFRAKTPAEVLDWVERSFTFSGDFSSSIIALNHPSAWVVAGVSVFLLFDQWLYKGRIEDWMGHRPLWLRWTIYAGLMYGIVAGTPILLEPFIYRGF